jgi:uncharacterized protein YuzE
MKLEYFADTDTLYIALRPGPGADAAEVAPGVVLDYDAEGHVMGVTVEHASQRAGLTSVQVTQIPAIRLPAA